MYIFLVIFISSLDWFVSHLEKYFLSVRNDKLRTIANVRAILLTFGDIDVFFVYQIAKIMGR